MSKTICEKCNCEITNNNFEKHYANCGKKRKNTLKTYKFIDGKYECPVCQKLYSNLGINGHVWRHSKHGEDYVNKFKLGRKSWNYGLTKETSEGLRKQGKSYSDGVKSGKIIPSQKGKPHSEEHKRKLSENKIKWLKENPDKVPYKLNHSSRESYPERIFKETLINNNINNWVQEYCNGIYRYDFAFPQVKLNVEIDGAQHLQEKVKTIDIRRDKWSNEQGWTVLRFTAKEINKDVISCVDVLSNILQVLSLVG